MKKTLIIGKQKYLKKNNVYISEWCNDNYHSIPRNYFFKSSINKKKNLLYFNRLYKKYYKGLEKYLIDSLKKNHQTEYDNRDWKILISQWLNWYIKIIINRFFIFNECINKKIYKIDFFLIKKIRLNSQGTFDICKACDDPYWNAQVYYKIFLFLNIKKNFHLHYKKNYKIEDYNYPYNYSFKLKFYNFISKIICKKNDIFFIGDYFPKFFKFKLFLKLKQFPSLWHKLPFCYSETNTKLRQKLSKKKTFNKDLIKSFLYSEIFNFLPNCLLEGLNKNKKAAEKLPYPKDPKIIFTANNYNSDELFKHWLIKKIKKGTKYFTGQHGTAYENNMFQHSYPPEILTSDRFFTWGWKYKDQTFLKKNIFKNLFVFNVASSKQYSPTYAKKKIIIILPMRFPNRYAWNSFENYSNVINLVKSFFKKINKTIITNITLRMYNMGNYSIKNSKENKNYLKIFKKITKQSKIDLGSKKINLPLMNNHFPIFFYISTGVLEMIALNKPFLLVISNYEWTLIPKKIINEYNQLYQCKILHKNVKTASDLINENYQNFDKWWLDTKRQSVLKNFRDKYARYSNNPINEFADKLLKK